jgi:hypothetical protein
VLIVEIVIVRKRATKDSLEFRDAEYFDEFSFAKD